jgi:4'-phosphopantetheinyl transferase EntD
MSVAISHGLRDAAAIAATIDGPWPHVGIDLLDPEDGPRLERLSTRVFSPEERALLGGEPLRRMLGWGAKEAVAKATSTGMFAFALDRVRVVAIDEAQGRARTNLDGVEILFEPHGDGLLVLAGVTGARRDAARAEAAERRR